MDLRFSSEFFAGNRQRLKELFIGTAPIVVTANGLLQRGNDSTFKFAQDANFWYLTGINEPDILLVMDRDKEYLIVPERSESRQAFDGVVEAEPLSRRSGITTVLNEKDGWDQLGLRLNKVKHVATLAVPPLYVEHYGMYTNPARAVLIEKIKVHNHDVELLDINQHLARLRMIKQPEELSAIQAAIDITVRTIKQATTAAKLSKFEYEYQIEAELSRGYRASGAAGHSFDPIVASGERACVLHSVANNGQMAQSELVIIDTGAEVEQYAADIARTLSLGPPSKRQQAVHAAVCDTQDYAFSLLKPGVILKDYEQQIEHFIGEKMRELGLIKSISHEEVRRFYPHATSHFLGLNVHDVGDYERPLEPGVVMTVEPGIYIHDEGIGVRIEDDVIITQTGIKILSKKLSRDLR